jgi:hypothetical protein
MSKKQETKDCGKEEHFTFTFIGFAAGAMLMILGCAWIQSRNEDAAAAEKSNKEVCADVGQKTRKYTKLYYGLYVPSQKHTHDELKDALAEILHDRAWDFERLRKELNCERFGE